MTTMDPGDPRVVRAASAVLAVAGSLEADGAAPADPETLAAAEARGYFTPGEDEGVRTRYQAYLAGRAALLTALMAMEEACGTKEDQWSGRLPAFAVALAAGGLVRLGSGELIAAASRSRLLRKKLDEADTRRGIPRKTFARIYRAATHPRRLARFHEALAFYRTHRDEILATADGGRYGELCLRLEAWVARLPATDFGSILHDRLRYRWFSFRRRHHSAWKRAVFGVFEDAGCRIADLRQPGIRLGPKQVTPELRDAVLRLARPGDVFVTRHDDALSNLFLPGFWPHAAYYYGSEAQRRALGVALDLPREAADPARFLEAKKDGVRFRPAEETLEVDRLVVLRPPLEAAAIAAALERAARHAGKLYDFVFDFRKSDRLVCTEVVYRAYHGELDLRLIETGGRLCLPAEELIDQALRLGFGIVATVNLGGGGLRTGSAAETALHGARAGI